MIDRLLDCTYIALTSTFTVPQYALHCPLVADCCPTGTNWGPVSHPVNVVVINPHQQSNVNCTFAMALSKCLTSPSCRLWLDRMVLMVSTRTCKASPQHSSCCSCSSWDLWATFSSSSSWRLAQLSQSGLPIGWSTSGLCPENNNKKYLSVTHGSCCFQFYFLMLKKQARSKKKHADSENSKIIFLDAVTYIIVIVNQLRNHQTPVSQPNK